MVSWMYILVIYMLFDWLLQEQGLDVIAEGLSTLKNMAGDINEVVICELCPYWF